MVKIEFGTDGWRDLMYDRFNLPNVSRVVEGIGAYVKEHNGSKRGVVVGYDARFFSDFFAQVTADLLAAQGIKVLMSKRDLPTPVLAYAVRQYQAFGAIIFTASHNPPAYNGVKFIPEYAGPATAEITAEIERRIPEVAPELTRTVTRQGETIDPFPSYLASLQKLIDVELINRSPLELGYDPMYATGRGIFERLFTKELTLFHQWRDPLFGGGMPDPQGQYLAELAQWVKTRTGRIGLATDGDADRFGVIDEGGVFLTPNQVLPLLTYHLVKNKGLKGVVGRSVATTHLLDALADELGLELIETPVGFKYLGEIMRHKHTVLVGEESGGLSIGGHIPEKDGILACALLAEFRVMAGKPLMEILKDLWDKVGRYYSRRLDLNVSEEEKLLILNHLQAQPPEKIGSKVVQELRRLDGYKFIFTDRSWCLIRPSGTENLIRFYLETFSSQGLMEMEAELELFIAKLKKN